MGWRAYVPVSVVLAMCGGVATIILVIPRIWRFPDPPPSITDTRACPDSTAELDQVTAHFAVKLPADATRVHFSSDFNSWFGEYGMEISFETTPAGLRSLIADSGFSAPKPAYPSTVPLPAACPGPLPFQRGLMTKSDARTLVVETSDPARPLVYIRAYDL